MSLDRYHRHELIDWFSQDQLARARVVVVGAGAVGNEVVKNLALLGVGEIRIFDFDLIEEHNLTRSVLFRDTDIGNSKADIAAQRAGELDPNISVTAVGGDFWDHLSLVELQGFDVLFCCVDNFEARIRCNTMCRIAGVDLINVGIDSRFALIEQFPFGRADCGCFECNLPPSVYRRISERYSCGHLRKLSFVERKVPTTIITSSAAASLAVSVGLRLGNDATDPRSMRYYLDTIAGHLTRTELDRVELCPCCSRFQSGLPIVACRPEIGAWPQDANDATVTFSEPLLCAYRIDDTVTPVFEPAARFDSDYPATLHSDPGLVDLEVRDQFTMTELVARFSSRAIPCKFAMVEGKRTATVFEFIREAK